jgi:hypothetical protein
MKTTTDRCDILHFAGFHHLSPALDDRSAPVFSVEASDRLTRCGWETFFKAMAARGLALTYDPRDAGSARFVVATTHAPSPSPTGDEAPRHDLAHAIDHSKRFVRALFPARRQG